MSQSIRLRLAAALAVSLGFPGFVSAGPLAGAAEGQVVAQTPVAAGVELQIVATGTSNQMAVFTRSETLTLDPVTGTFSGTVTFTAGNGHTLVGTVSGEFVGPGTATGTYEWTSGTGRFAHPYGTTRFVAQSADGVHFGVQFKGSLSVARAPQ